MTHVTPFSNPFLLGFETVEKILQRIGKTDEAYPAYNIERLHKNDDANHLRITLAVAGFKINHLNILLDDNQLVIHGKQTDNQNHQYLYRGIAARQFQRIFVLAEGMNVTNAELKNGLLSINLYQPKLKKEIKQIPIKVSRSEL
ncbi:Hsp20 family protein [Bartonella krasnovii]|uniref:Hsp20 family protein n=1 Tax=Bartonella krasnovii TaxID=2267275 RepID=A0A5B9D4F5_9HYPH|nr:Hsp20 family protein [Bartonella krasnovii]QEE13081.1 Hsp20 family protein [Bartonella krasnovii]UNF29197.1 Hsp20 family protein [Bartonella krasnovii]UNF35554.1 Hsp20 family protein [Bartonella krasnovii]UNF37169.1 Hsp20 family protein [Bartonella krasnovii]UNF38869.1 Hsp20 family protein [Bartonella krasnovii]